MRVVLFSAALIFALTACSSDDMPPLQAAVVVPTTSTTDDPTTTSGASIAGVIDDVDQASAAAPVTETGLPDGFTIDGRTCYQHDAGETLTTAMLYISDDGDSLVGGIEFGDRAGFSYTAMAGTRRGTSFSVNVVHVETGNVENQDWFFEPFGVLLPEQIVLDIIDCDVVVEAVIAIENEAASFPDAP